MKDVYTQTRLRNLKRAAIKFKQEQLNLALKNQENKQTIQKLHEEIDELKTELKKLI